jgi:deoxyribodipyrimidine photolyase-related protein
LPSIASIPPNNTGVVRLLIVLGDQLDREMPVLSQLDPVTDRILMAEVPDESTRVPSHQARTALVFSAMRHFAADVRARGITVDYLRIGEHRYETLAGALSGAMDVHRPKQVLGILPGDFGVKLALENACAAQEITLDWQPDTHFLSTPEEFARFAQGRKVLRLEHWYRQLRRRTGILMDGDEPVGGTWNFDADNRSSFSAAGPGVLRSPATFTPDSITREAMADVLRVLPGLPGTLEGFNWPVTPADAHEALVDFIQERLPLFGHYQDAMWQGEDTLYHSRISAALNLKLINPRIVIEAAVEACTAGHAPLAAVEGFVRQILGWREYVRGLYWHAMPEYANVNALDALEPLPSFYWTGDTEYACLADTVGRTLRNGYAHHIERLMVTGLFALLLGVQPREIHHWYLGIYVDAFEWVELPNVMGMSQYADGGIMASKPYIASGRYIERMSNHCAHCPKKPGEATGPKACPYTTLYWDFLDRHRERFVRHPRLGQQVRNLDARPESARLAIREAASDLRRKLRNAGEIKT